MADPLEDKWHSRDLPTLRAAARIADGDMVGARFQEIVAETGISLDDSMLALRALQDGGLVEVRWMAPAQAARVLHISGEARRLVGLWPSPEVAADRLIAAIEAAIERSDDPEERTRLRKFRDGLLGAGRDLAVAIGAAVITGQVS